MWPLPLWRAQESEQQQHGRSGSIADGLIPLTNRLVWYSIKQTKQFFAIWFLLSHAVRSGQSKEPICVAVRRRRKKRKRNRDAHGIHLSRSHVDGDWYLSIFAGSELTRRIEIAAIPLELDILFSCSRYRDDLFTFDGICSSTSRCSRPCIRPYPYAMACLPPPTPLLLRKAQQIHEKKTYSTLEIIYCSKYYILLLNQTISKPYASGEKLKREGVGCCTRTEVRSPNSWSVRPEQKKSKICGIHPKAKGKERRQGRLSRAAHEMMYQAGFEGDVLHSTQSCATSSWWWVVQA